MKWTWTGKLFVWYWLKIWGWEIFLPRWCPGISLSNSGERGWVQFLTSKCITVMLQPPYSPDFGPCNFFFITKSKISSERTSFWVNRRHPYGCNTGPKWHPTNCIPGMLQTMLAPLEMVCAGTRDILWRWWPHCSWINKTFFLEPVSLLYCQTSYAWSWFCSVTDKLILAWQWITSCWIVVWCSAIHFIHLTQHQPTSFHFQMC